MYRRSVSQLTAGGPGMIQSVLRIAMALTPWGSNSGGVNFSAPTLGPTTSCKMGTGPLPGIKRPEHSFDHPPTYRTEVKERVSSTCTRPVGLQGLFHAKCYLYLYLYLFSHGSCLYTVSHASLHNTKMAVAITGSRFPT